MLVVSALGMASASGVSILERTIASVASIVLGLLLAWPLSEVAAVFFGKLMLGAGAVLRYTFSGEGFAITLVTILVFGWLANRIPARRAIQVSPRDALAYE